MSGLVEVRDTILGLDNQIIEKYRDITAVPLTPYEKKKLGRIVGAVAINEFVQIVYHAYGMVEYVQSFSGQGRENIAYFYAR